MSETQRRVPAGARFRRAEGIDLVVRLCDWPRHIRAQPKHGMKEAILDGAQLRLLTRLARWHRADELGCDEELLATWESRDLLFWSSANPTRALGGAELDGGDGPIALRRNVYVRAQVARGDELDSFEFMPRRGELSGAELVGVELAVHEWHEIVLRARVVCCARHGALLRDLIPRLDGRHASATLAAGDAEAACALEALDALGLLEQRAAPAIVPPTDGRARVTWLGHAAALVEMGGRRLLVDPIVFPTSLPSRAGHDIPPDWRDLGPIDAILITHADNDHLSPSSLMLFPRDTPIFIPAAPIRRAHQVDMEALLATLGFTRVEVLAEWGGARIGDAVEVVAAPFVGEDWGLPLAKCTWLVAAPEATLYFSADSAFMPEVYARLRERHAIDLALLGVTGNEEAHVAPSGFGYGEFYEGWIPDEKRNEWIVHTAGPVESAEAARLLGARRAFGYAAGGTTYHDVAYSDRGTHADFAAALAGGPVEPVTLQLGVPYLLDRKA